MYSTPPSLIDQLQKEPFTLCMSSGFFGFYAHAGMLEALLEAGLRPQRMVGSSAGALVGGCVAAGVDIQTLRDILFSIDRQAFWDPAFGGGLLRGERMDALLRDALPITTIEDLPTTWACSAWSLKSRSTVVLDRGDAVHAIRASAAFPGMFQPVRIGDDRFLDGGIADRPGFESLEMGERTLYHHLSTRSPWRRKVQLTHPPMRENTLVLDLGAFRRLSPFNMAAGAQVYQEAKERTLRALERPAGSFRQQK